MATEDLDIQNFYVDSLKSNISAATTIIPLNNAPTIQEGYLVLSPDDPTKKEIIYFTSSNSGAGTVTCPSAALGRGIGGTSAQTHTAGEVVKCSIVAEYWRDLKTLVAATSLTLIYPVGSLYITTLATNPGTLLGFGTWIAAAEGQAIVGKAAAGTFATAGASVGAETSGHTHGGVDHLHSLNGHSHTATTDNGGTYDGGRYSSIANYSTGWSPPGHYHSLTTSGNWGTTGACDRGMTTGNTAPSVVQPSLVVYIWKRTA
jgi:hypothetical protein